VLVSTYHLSDTERSNAWRQWIDERPVLIGRAQTCHVVVDDPEVADEHVRLSTEGVEIVVENLAAPITVGVATIATGATARTNEGAPIRIGDTIVRIRMQRSPVVTTRGGEPQFLPLPANPPRPVVPQLPFNPPRPAEPALRPPPPRPRPRNELLSPDATEQQLLVALRAAPADASTRMVYADWLEERGLKAKTELVRHREHLDTFMHRNASTVDWRAVAVRTPIDHCAAKKCPQFWDALAPNAATDYARACAACKKQVAYCADLRDVFAAAWNDMPVVFDAAVDRVAAHATYRRRELPAGGDDELEDDPDGYTVDTPPSPGRR
jgi:uncharacterized protein (TIGR02996 family)